MTFTQEQTTTAIRAAVAKRGRNFVNDKEIDGIGTCQYVWDGRPSCIVGNVMAYLGMDLDTLSNNEGDSAHAAFSQYFDYDTLWALNLAQEVQDKREPWGAALAAYESRISRGDHFRLGY